MLTGSATPWQYFCQGCWTSYHIIRVGATHLCGIAQVPESSLGFSVRLRYVVSLEPYRFCQGGVTPGRAIYYALYNGFNQQAQFAASKPQWCQLSEGEARYEGDSCAGIPSR